jgi:hypothetical protein
LTVHFCFAFHVTAYIEKLSLPESEGQGLSKPTVKQHLAALRMLFGWLVVDGGRL